MLGTALVAGEPETAAQRGYRFLRTKQYLPADFDQEVFDNLWKVWPEPERTRAKNATPAERWKLTFSRYGLMESSDQPQATGPALGYVDDGKGGWVMNCLACHAGKVGGCVIPGLPNSHFALETLTEDVRRTKLSMKKPLSHLDLGTLKFPLGTTNGTTNSVIFGVLLSNLRDEDMKVHPFRPAPKLEHHDMDAPPFWNVKKKSRLYIDGHIGKSHRTLMQFMLLPRNDEKTVKEWEPDFLDILAWIESVEAPRWPWKIDKTLATRGKAIFEKNCASCHGTCGDDPTYPERMIPIKKIGTDPVRLRALTRSKHLEWVKKGWISDYGKVQVDIAPQGYIAPPLDGVWASGPYFHNGSVPTLWHVLHPGQRPQVWKRSENGYDQSRVGLEVQEFPKRPDHISSPAERRMYFDTSGSGKSAEGHDFPSTLTEPEKMAVLEYLKTL
ncbi:MAG: cytochrome c [Planctomycetaceae bacterium]|nr:cytochrome c [Planctomycetaceae bacterium]